MARQKLFFTFKFADGRHTTLANNHHRVAGTITAYTSRLARDRVTTAKEFTHCGCTIAATRKQLCKLGYSGALNSTMPEFEIIGDLKS